MKRSGMMMPSSCPVVLNTARASTLKANTSAKTLLFALNWRSRSAATPAPVTMNTPVTLALMRSAAPPTTMLASTKI